MFHFIKGGIGTKSFFYYLATNIKFLIEQKKLLFRNLTKLVELEFVEKVGTTKKAFFRAKL